VTFWATIGPDNPIDPEKETAQGKAAKANLDNAVRKVRTASEKRHNRAKEWGIRDVHPRRRMNNRP
jgi:hypothetical protein